MTEEQKKIEEWKDLYFKTVEERNADETTYRYEIDGLKKELAKYKRWVDDLQSGMYINCVYCGHRYGPGETTPVSMAATLKAHIEACPKHPMSALKEELASICRILQQYQPAGSPPPGGLLVLATWILGNLSDENKQLRLRERGYLMELRDYGRTVATLRDQIEHLKAQLPITS